MGRRARKTSRVTKAPARHPGGAPRTHQSCPLGRRIEALVAARQLTLTDLAEHVGLSRSGLNDIRRGRFRPRLDTLDRIAVVLGVPPAALLAE